MRITESQLRRIIREELIREQSSWIPYSGEKSAQGLSAAQQLGYAASRAVLGATPTGAQQVAQGKTDVLPTAGEALSTAWNSKIMDWTLTSLGAISDLVPVVGTGISISIAGVQAAKAAAAGDALGALLCALATIPAVGDAIGATGKAIKAGLKISREIASALVRALGGITSWEVISIFQKIAQAMPDTAKAAKVNGIASAAAQAKDRFVADLKRSYGIA